MEIPKDEGVAEEQRTEGPEGEKRPEGNRHTAVRAAHHNQGEPEQRTHEGTEHERYENGSPAQKSGNYTQQHKFTTAHPFSTGPCLIAHGDTVEEASAQQNPQCTVQ